MLVPVIGLEIHCELDTKSKVFCTCPNDFGGEPNTRVCPTCMGLPGTLPVLNRTAVEYTIKAGYALNCTPNLHTEFDRKNYFYPDLPKAYQISQLYEPLCVKGAVTIPDGKGGKKSIRINRIHLEEDAGKLIHDDLSGLSLADYNRCGVPLIETVTEPDLASAEEAAALVREINRLFRYTEISDCRMERGSMRVDVNISLKEEDADQLGTRAEIKNLNSVKSVIRAIEYEIKRQTGLIAEGKRIVQETRSFNENTGQTRSLRTKEDSHDYRYFKDPDIQPVIITEAQVSALKDSLPAMPDKRYATYTEIYGLTPIDAENLVDQKVVSDFYEAALTHIKEPKLVANMILVELFRYLKEEDSLEITIPFSAEDFADLLKRQVAGTINKNDAKTVLSEMYHTGKPPAVIIKEKGFEIVNDNDAVEKVIDEVLDTCAAAVKQYRSGEKKVFGFLMGQCNQRLKGKATPALIKELLEAALNA